MRHRRAPVQRTQALPGLSPTASARLVHTDGAGLPPAFDRRATAAFALTAIRFENSFCRRPVTFESGGPGAGRTVRVPS